MFRVCADVFYEAERVVHAALDCGGHVGEVQLRGKLEGGSYQRESGSLFVLIMTSSYVCFHAQLDEAMLWFLVVMKSRERV